MAACLLWFLNVMITHDMSLNVTMLNETCLEILGGFNIVIFGDIEWKDPSYPLKSC